MKRNIWAVSIIMALFFAVPFNSFADSANAGNDYYYAELECGTKSCEAKTFGGGGETLYVSMTAYVTLASYGVTIPANPITDTHYYYVNVTYGLGWSSNYLAYARSTHGDTSINDIFSLYADAS